MGNELYCCSDEPQPRRKQSIVATKEKPRVAPQLRPITEVVSTSEPTINILQPQHTNIDRHSGKSMPNEHQDQRDSFLSGTMSERPNKCSQLIPRQSHYHKVASLGKGSFGKVYLVKPKTSGCARTDSLSKCPSECGETSYAMKVIHKRKLDDELSVHSLMLERRILSTIKSNFIINLKCSFQSKKSVFFVMDYAPGGDLYSYLDNPFVPEKVRMFKEQGQHATQFVMGCVVLALESLHASNIIYRDLKPENVLVFQNGYVKLCDFGLAEQQREDKIISTLIAGTKIYLAPEIVDDGIYTRFIDLWALGVFLYELVFGKPPFPIGMIVPNRFKKIARKAEASRSWPEAPASEQVKDLIHKLLKVRPAERIGAESFNEIKQHPFFHGLLWDRLSSMQLESPLKKIVDKFSTGSARQVEHHSDSGEDDIVEKDIPHFAFHPASSNELSTNGQRCIT